MTFSEVVSVECGSGRWKTRPAAFSKYQIGPEKPRNVQDFVAFMVDHLVDVDFPESKVAGDNGKDLSG